MAVDWIVESNMLAIQHIEDWKEKEGLKQAQVCNRLGLSKVALSRALTGKRSLSIPPHLLQPICHGQLKMSCHDFMFRRRDGSYIQDLKNEILLPLKYQVLARRLSSARQNVITDILAYARTVYSECTGYESVDDEPCGEMPENLPYERLQEYQDNRGEAIGRLRSPYIDMTVQNPLYAFGFKEKYKSAGRWPKRKIYYATCVKVSALLVTAVDYFFTTDYTRYSTLLYLDHKGRKVPVDKKNIIELISICLRVDSARCDDILGYAYAVLLNRETR